MDSSTFQAKWFKKLVVTDDLYVAAIDNLFINFGKFDIPKSPNLTGIGKVDGHWILVEGEHSLTFTDASSIKATVCINEKKRHYKLDLEGKTAIKTVHNIMNSIRIVVENDAFISALDNFILHEHKLIEKGNYVADVVSVPMNSIYTLTSKGETGYIIIKREASKDKDKKIYIIDIVGKFYNDKLKTILYGDANRIKVVHCTILNHQINVRLMNKLPLDQIYNGQKIIIDYVINTYTSKKTKNVTILVSGPTGVGKSTLALLIAQKIKELGIDPYLIKGFNVMAEEMQYHPIIGHYSPKSTEPIILLLDEFDIAMQNADAPIDHQHGKRESLAIAANKTNLNNFLDTINDESFLITVVTTNATINDLNATYGVYCRKGRFDKHFEMASKDDTNIFEPFN